MTLGRRTDECIWKAVTKSWECAARVVQDVVAVGLEPSKYESYINNLI